MSNSQLLVIHPLDELRFPFELKKQISCSFYLTNKTNNHVAFKAWSTNSEYEYKPNTGVVRPKSTYKVVVTMQAQEEAPSEMQCNDKFMIQAVKASRNVTVDDFTEEMFSKKAGRLVEETTLGVNFAKQTTVRSCNNKILAIEPQDRIVFRFATRKEMSYTISVTNKTDNYVAIKVTTNNPSNYILGFRKGVVPPRATCELIAVMGALKEAPPNMQCKDKFIIQAVIASPGVTLNKEVTEEMFTEEAGKLIEETTLSVAFIDTPKCCICL